jgi:restriction endonuclease Mrr
MTVLDELTGFEFEDLMQDVFRNLGYRDVRQAERTADEGRDLLMQEVDEGTRRAIIVECKHTDTVGRPAVQKLHSAIATYDFDGPKRGMAVTTGRFTHPAREYVEELRQNDDPYPIELLDGQDLRDIADDIGLDLYNGRIEILCDQTLRPFEPPADVGAPAREAFRDIEHIQPAEVDPSHAEVTFRPVVAIAAETRAVFETSVGVIHRINDRTKFVLHAGGEPPNVADEDVASLVADHLRETVKMDQDYLAEPFDRVEEQRFGQTQTEYKEWAEDLLQEHHTTTVTYTGDNNVTYNKTCTPDQSDINVRSIEPVYLPEVRLTIERKQYTYPYEYHAAGADRVITEDGVHRCVHCNTNGTEHTYTYCPNCGAIACGTHFKTERLEGKPVCTGCAITGSFMLKTNYFYDEENLETFRERYAAMPFHQKIRENSILLIAALAGTVLTLVILLMIVL